MICAGAGGRHHRCCGLEWCSCFNTLVAKSPDGGAGSGQVHRSPDQRGQVISSNDVPGARHADASGPRFGGWSDARLTAGLTLVGLVVGVFSLQPLFQHTSPGIYDLDPSWELSLGAALAQHLQFGTQYLFTYGPLGFLQYPLVYPATALTYAAASVSVLFHLVYPVALLLVADLVRRCGKMSPLQGSALLVATIAVALWTDIAADLGTIAEMVSLISLTVCFLRPVARGSLVWASGAGILLAFGALFKVDLLGVAVAELALLAVVAWLLPGRPMRIPALTTAGFVLGYPLLWLATGQHLSNLPHFWVGSWQLSSGYSAAMSTAQKWQLLAVVSGLAVAATIAASILGMWRQRAFLVQQAVLVLTLPWLFVSWKEGLVRSYGIHNFRALALLGAVLGVAWLVALLSSRLWTVSTVGPAVAACLSAAVICATFGPLDYPPFVLIQATFADPFPSSLQTGSEYISPRILASLRGHTVNALPWDVSMVVDNHLRWDPVPEPQTYSAYTSYLDHIDAARLASPRAASRLVVSIRDIDSRYLFWDPPAVWDTVLSRYSCQATTRTSAVLDRRAPRTGTEHKLGSETGSFDRWFTVPLTSRPYEFADVQITSSLEGDALGLVLRQAPIFAMVRLSDGSVSGPLRVIAGTAGDGLYLSHYITSPRQLCGVLTGKSPQASRIVAIRFTTPDPRQWSESITMAFWGANAGPKAREQGHHSTSIH